jgi:hypothetical protein
MSDNNKFQNCSDSVYTNRKIYVLQFCVAQINCACDIGKKTDIHDSALATFSSEIIPIFSWGLPCDFLKLAMKIAPAFKSC